MIATRKNVNDGPRPTRGPSLWLFLAMAGLCMTVWLSQRFYSDPQKVETTGARQFSPAKPPSETPSPPAHVNPARRAAVVAPANRLADHLARLLRDLQGEDDPMRGEALIADFLAGLGTKDIAAALDILKDAKPADLAEDLSRRLVRRWAEGSPQDVAAWMNNLPSGSQREVALDNLAFLWANSQLTNAIGWAQSLADPAERDRALTAVANESVRADPLTALQLAAGLPPDSQRDDLVRRAAMEWASGDPRNAVAWAEQIPDAELRAKVLAGEAVAWAAQDPESAAILAVQELPSGRLQEDTVVSIVQRWARQEPETAAAWVEQFPDGALRAAAIENLLVQWSQKDAAAARQWRAGHS
ncbi:MAG: hypothetical protein ABSA47_11220 [Verrucomicrobiota bacterium]|jgi:hypothetical protein